MCSISHFCKEILIHWSRVVRGTAQVSDKASGFEEEDRESDRQGIPRTRQEQPPNLQLLGLISLFFVLLCNTAMDGASGPHNEKPMMLISIV